MEMTVMIKLNSFVKQAQAAVLALALGVGAAGVVMAHDGMEDIQGTVQKVDAKSVSVKTTKGKMMDVKLDASTEFTRGKAEAKQTDLQAGDKVVIHAMEMNGALTAHLVQLPAAKAAAKKAAK
jgi:Cu/Ag efflux protein CusF